MHVWSARERAIIILLAQHAPSFDLANYFCAHARGSIAAETFWLHHYIHSQPVVEEITPPRLS